MSKLVDGHGIPHRSGEETLDLLPIANNLWHQAVWAKTDLQAVPPVMELGRCGASEAGVHVTHLVDRNGSSEWVFFARYCRLKHQLSTPGRWRQMIRKYCTLTIGNCCGPGSCVAGLVDGPLSTRGDLPAAPADDLEVLVLPSANGRSSSLRTLLRRTPCVEVLA